MTVNDPHFIVRSGTALKGTVTVPGDKSLSHRAILLGMLADGITRVQGWLSSGDTEATLRAAKGLGVQIDRQGANQLQIHGGNLYEPTSALDLVNAGTGIRLLAGIMAGMPFGATLDGSPQLRRRPMRRIIEPLTQMGARIDAMHDRAPMTFSPSSLHGIEYEMPVASAQVKSAILLAGLFAKGSTRVVQPGPARDHTERMLGAMGVQLEMDHSAVTIIPRLSLQPLDLRVPGDFSSAAFLLVAGCVLPDSEITITGVNLNETRTGLLEVLNAMGAKITVTETGLEGGEPVGEICVKHGTLRGVEVGGETVVRMIDEFPVLMVAALCAEGETIVRDARELRVKETDRIAVMCGELQKLGANITETDDGFRIMGGQHLVGATVDGHDDHRIAMSMTIAGLIAEGRTIVLDAKCTGDSFPGFRDTLAALGADIQEAAGRAHEG